MRRTARGLGHHSQNSANASRAVVKGSSAHRRTMSTITPRLKLKPPPRPSSRSMGRSQTRRGAPTRRPTRRRNGTLPKRVPTSVVRLSASTQGSPSCSYVAARGRCAAFTKNNATRARPSASSCTHSSRSNSQSVRRLSSVADSSTAANRRWTTASACLMVLGTGSFFGWFLSFTTDYLPEEGPDLQAQISK